jgi:hypothetical protein
MASSSLSYATPRLDEIFSVTEANNPIFQLGPTFDGDVRFGAVRLGAASANDDRDRDGDCSSPPGQTRTGPIWASGSFHRHPIRGLQLNSESRHFVGEQWAVSRRVGPTLAWDDLSMPDRRRPLDQEGPAASARAQPLARVSYRRVRAVIGTPGLARDLGTVSTHHHGGSQPGCVIPPAGRRGVHPALNLSAWLFFATFVIEGYVLLSAQLQIFAL